MYFIFKLFLASALASIAPVNEKPKGVVFVRKIQNSQLSDQLIYPAKVVPQINTTLLAESDGIVTKINAPLGQSVSRNQKVMVLSHIDPIYQYAPMSILSPVTGVVSAVEITEGTQVSKGQKLASVTDPHKIKISIEVPAQDLASISRGMKGDFRPMGSDEIIPVVIKGISPFVDPATGTASCEIGVDTSKKQKVKTLLSPGLLGQTLFQANLHSGIRVPDFALFYKGTDTYVRVVEGEKAKQVQVTIGKKQRGQVEILTGLKTDTLLVERASRYVGDGESVTVETANEDVGVKN